MIMPIGNKLCDKCMGKMKHPFTIPLFDNCTLPMLLDGRVGVIANGIVGLGGLPEGRMNRW